MRVNNCDCDIILEPYCDAPDDHVNSTRYHVHEYREGDVIGHHGDDTPIQLTDWDHVIEVCVECMTSYTHHRNIGGYQTEIRCLSSHPWIFGNSLVRIIKDVDLARAGRIR